MESIAEKAYKAILEQAAAYANQWMVAKYDEVNPPALKRLLANGVKLHGLLTSDHGGLLQSGEGATCLIAKENPSFKKVYDFMTTYSNNGYQWFQVAELGYDSFMVRHSRG